MCYVYGSQGCLYNVARPGACVVYQEVLCNVNVVGFMHTLHTVCVSLEPSVCIAGSCLLQHVF